MSKKNPATATNQSEKYGTFDPASHQVVAMDDIELESRNKDENPESDSRSNVVLLEEKAEYFEWKDVNVTIEGKQILHGINGKVQSGQLLGILGGSGAGKTTLLNSISGRLLSKTPSKLSLCCPIKKFQSLGTQLTGSVAYKGKEFKLGSSDHIKYISGYVMQNDIMCPTASGLEALTFSSKLRSSKSEEEQLKQINDVIHSLKLNDCKDTKIGNDAIRGMSGGEKKRTSVGVELVTHPDLIFLDEPTSGLDSFTALKTLEILKGLTVKDNKQVIATIHQPSSDIFNMLDVLILLAKGHVVYYGSSKEVIEYFSKLGYDCPKYSNIADYVVNQVQENSQLFIDAWKKHETDYINLSFSEYSTLKPTREQTSSFCQQMIAVTKREFQILFRDPRPSKIRGGQTVIFALFVSILYYSLPYTAEGLRDRFGAIFFLTINSSMTGLISTLVVFPEQRLLFERERDSDMYYTTTYILAKFIVQIPEQAIFTLIYLLIIYWTIGLDSTFYEAYIALLLCITSTGSFGMIIGCFAKNAGEAMQLMPIAFVPFLLFTNFMVSLDQIPSWIRWLQWLDPFKYMVDALSITEFKGQLHDEECFTNNEGQDVCQYMYDGDTFLNQIGAGYDEGWMAQSWINSVYFDWIMLFALVMIFKLLTWLILVKNNGY